MGVMENRFESLPRDLERKILLHLSNDSLIQFHKTNKRFAQKLPSFTVLKLGDKLQNHMQEMGGLVSLEEVEDKIGALCQLLCNVHNHLVVLSEMLEKEDPRGQRVFSHGLWMVIDELRAVNNWVKMIRGVVADFTGELEKTGNALEAAENLSKDILSAWVPMGFMMREVL